MSLKTFIRRWLGVPDAPSPVVSKPVPVPMRVPAAVLERFSNESASPVFRIPQMAPGVDAAGMAQDFAGVLDYANTSNVGLGFIGYPTLASLAQLPEYRKISTKLAREMVRKWIRLKVEGDESQGKADKVKQLAEELKRVKLKTRFREVAEQDGFFGRAQLYIDLKSSGTRVFDNPTELAAPLARDPAKIRKGDLVGFNLVEPMWCYPAGYNTTNPLAPDFYRPTAWQVMDRKVHASRLLHFVGMPVPDMLKPAYMFGGMSMTQIAQPYVEHWVRTRDSVSDIIHSFSVSGIKTDLRGILSEGGADDMKRRAELFNKARDNRGLMMLDKETEEFFQFNTPLGTLDHLQAQAQEQMASVASIPLVVLLGISPTGLNASSDGEIRVFYDWIHSQQETFFGDQLHDAIRICQLNLWGEVDEDIAAEFNPLMQLTPEQLANVQKVKADTDAVLITSAVIAPEEARARVASDPDSGYVLDLSAPELSEPDDDDEDPARRDQ